MKKQVPFLLSIESFQLDNLGANWTKYFLYARMKNKVKSEKDIR